MLYSCFSTAAAEAAGVPGKSHDQGSSEEDQQGAEPGPVWEAEGGKCSSYRPLETTGKAGQLGSQYRVVPTLKDHGIDHKNVFSENRWSLRTGQLYWNVGYFARNMWDCSTQRQVVSQGSGLARGFNVLWNYFPVSMQVWVPLLVPSSHLVQWPCVINLLYVVNKLKQFDSTYEHSRLLVLRHPVSIQRWPFKTDSLWGQVHLYWNAGPIYKSWNTPYMVFQDRWCLIGVVSQDRVFCTFIDPPQQWPLYCYVLWFSFKKTKTFL